MEIIGFPDYLIYEDGKIWSKERVKGGKGYLYKGRFMKPQLVGPERNYYQIYLWKDNKIKKRFKIHRLVAEHYIPNPENKREVDHINRNPMDNRVENLRWVTRVENEANKGINKNNKSGHKNVSWDKGRGHPNGGRWRFRSDLGGGASRYFKSKTDCLCYKFIYLLKIKIKGNNLPRHHSSMLN